MFHRHPRQVRDVLTVPGRPHPALRFLIDSYGMSQLLLGTDHPFTIMEKAPVARIDRLGLAAADRDALLAGNARRFLGIA